MSWVFLSALTTLVNEIIARESWWPPVHLFNFATPTLIGSSWLGARSFPCWLTVCVCTRIAKYLKKRHLVSGSKGIRSKQKIKIFYHLFISPRLSLLNEKWQNEVEWRTDHGDSCQPEISESDAHLRTKRDKGKDGHNRRRTGTFFQFSRQMSHLFLFLGRNRVEMRNEVAY